MGQRSKVLDTDGPTPKFLYAILKQLDLKSVRRIDWNKVAADLEISNGHAARMRYSRFRNQMEPSAHKIKKKNTKKLPKGDPNEGMNGFFPSSSHLQFHNSFAVKAEEPYDFKYPHFGYHQPHLPYGEAIKVEPGHPYPSLSDEHMKMKNIKAEFLSPRIVKRDPSQTDFDAHGFAESSDSDSWPQVISANCSACPLHMSYSHDALYSIGSSIPSSMSSSSGPFYSPFRTSQNGMNDYGLQQPVFGGHTPSWNQTVATDEAIPAKTKTNSPPVETKIKPELIIEIDDFQTT